MLNIKDVPIPTPDSWYTEKASELSKNNIKEIYYAKMKYDPRDITPISFIPSFNDVLNKHINNNEKSKEDVLYL